MSIKAKKVFDDYKEFPNGDIRQGIIWRFPKTKKQPLGIKYRFAFIYNGKCILRYDNEVTKDHHKHIYNKEIKIKFTNIESLFNKFIKEVKQLREKLLED